MSYQNIKTNKIATCKIIYYSTSIVSIKTSMIGSFSERSTRLLVYGLKMVALIVLARIEEQLIEILSNHSSEKKERKGSEDELQRKGKENKLKKWEIDKVIEE